jgi:hypothetical protein
MAEAGGLAVLHCAAINQAPVFCTFIVDKEHPGGVSAIRAFNFLAMKETAWIFGSIRDNQSRRAIRFDYIDAVDSDAIEVHGFAQTVCRS